MVKASYFSRAGISNEFLAIIREKSEIELNRRSLPDILVYPVLFLAMALATSIFRTHPQETVYFGILSLLISVLRLWNFLSFEKLRKEGNQPLWRHFFITGNIVAALTWGLAMGKILSIFHVSWTSFFTILINCAICTHTIPAFLSNLKVLAIHLFCLLVPSILASFIFLEDIQGIALGIFFLGFFVFLVVEGQLHGINYWRMEQGRERMRAMLDAMPGTLAWVSSDLKYLGVNRKLSDIWNLAPQYFIGQMVGFLDRTSLLREFCRNLFTLPDEHAHKTLELSFVIAGKPRRYFLVAEKCNHGTEALIIGLDVTEQKSMEEQVNKIKVLSQLFIVGELTRIYCQEIKYTMLSRDLEKIANLNATLGHLVLHESEEFQVKDVTETINEILNFTREHYKAEGIRVTFQTDDADKKYLIHCRPMQVFTVLINIINNAYEEIRTLPEGVRWIKISLNSSLLNDLGFEQTHRGDREDQESIVISIADGGRGVPENIRDRIFDPLFSTKKMGETTGLGLGLSLELTRINNGQLFLDTKAADTTFVVSFPKV